MLVFVNYITLVITSIVLIVSGISMSWTAFFAWLAINGGGGAVISTLVAIFLNGQSVLEMLYKPSEDDYELADKDEQSFPTILIQNFDNYVCYDPDPVHAL
ncbi:MAG: hypothetical protein Ta2A_01920 [Treponemataceae bacterium]|nr:MAG: hypothetical protein Ta2A_01920 [Treponemataceae bacterium]